MKKVRRFIHKNGRFRAKAIVVRQVNGIEIVFYDSRSIYVKSEYGVWVVFRRWGGERDLGSYSSGWRNFRTMLMYEKSITFTHCHQLAFRNDIISFMAKKPELDGKTVEIITTNGGKKHEGKHE